MFLTKIMATFKRNYLKSLIFPVLNASMETRLTSIHSRAGSRTRLFDFDIASKDRYKMKGFLKDRQTHNHT
jgi:hypothetical protein